VQTRRYDTIICSRNVAQEQDRPAEQAQRSASWNKMYKLLHEYQSENGDCLVPQRYKRDPKLGLWVMDQRRKYPKLSDERRRRLDDIGFVLNVREGGWDAMMQRLELYHSIHGDCRVPPTYEQDGRKLGKWVANQRSKYPHLSAERRRRLDCLGFVIVTHEEKWDAMLERLQDYKRKNGDCRVPARYEQDPKLGYWVNAQRSSYQTLSVGRRQRLDDLGFVVDLHSENWKAMWEQLKNYRTTHGDCRVPTWYKANPYLGKWVRNQHRNYVNLSVEQRQRLEDIGFVVETDDVTKERRQQLEANKIAA
jgi:hypothetical protein